MAKSQKDSTKPDAGPSANGDGYYEQVVQSLSSGVLTVDAAGKVLTVNAAAMQHLNLAAEALAPGETLHALPNAEPFQGLFLEVKGTGKAVNRREITLDLEGEGVRQLGLSASPLDGPQPFNGVIFLFTDLTELRRLERAAELNRQLAALGELTAGVVHELRNPLSVISGMAELMLRRADKDDGMRKSAETILKETLNLERSISRFLGFTRPYDVHLGPCKPAVVADRAVQLCRRRADRSGTRLESQVAGDLPDIEADADRLAQALANIINNGMDAAGATGCVSLATRYDTGDGRVVFEIVDTGPGIDVKPGEDIFAPFFTNKEGGTGLGLTIVHRIVAAHRGLVSCDNAPGVGARFQIRVPLSEE